MDILSGIASIGAVVGGVKSVVAGLKSNGQTATVSRTAAQRKFEAEMAKASERFLQLRDRNGNGTLDVAELGGTSKTFAAADKNGDGQVTLSELKQAALANPSLLAGGSVARAV